jgi:site-specific DNA-methyltransferase (adenine-specific)
VLDPFMGSGSTLKAAELEGFRAIGIELSAEYIEIARRRIASDAPLFADVRESAQEVVE